jgi:5-methylcytosine-specific restriction endonuclease McrA
MTTLSELPWTEQKKIAAWTACRTYLDWPPIDWRIDRFGYLIRRSDHGKQTEYGWEVDHVVALALGGADTLDNVEALHWRKNRQLGGLLGNALRDEPERPMTQPRGLFGKRGFGF